MRVVYLNPSGQLGGAERSLLDLIAEVRAARPDWVLRLITGGNGPLVSRARELGVSAAVVEFPRAVARLGDSALGGPTEFANQRTSLIRSLSLAGPAIVGYARRLRSAVREFEPDLIHTNGFKMHILGVWACPAGVSVVWHIRDYVRARPLMSRLMRAHASRCDAVVANSDSVAQDAREVCGSRSQVFRIYNGVDLEGFSPCGPELDLDAIAEMPPAHPGVIRVGMLATLARWKGHETFLRALAMLPADLPVRGYVIGGAIYERGASQYRLDELRAIAAREGVERRLGFTGYLDDPAAALRALDIAVHASIAPEPFGMVIAEAMACGRAVIAASGGGASEVFSDGIDALAHPPGDAAALARRIGELAVDRELRVRLGRAARRTAEQRFGRDHLARELLPIYSMITKSAA